MGKPSYIYCACRYSESPARNARSQVVRRRNDLATYCFVRRYYTSCTQVNEWPGYEAWVGVGTQSGNIFMEVQYELPARFVRIWVVFGLMKNPDEVYK